MSSGFFPGLKAIGSAFTGAVVASCNAITSTANAANEAAQTVEKGASWLNAQAGRMLADLTVEVATERGWPNATPKEVAMTLAVLKSMGSTLSEKEAALLENYNVAKTNSPPPQQAIIPPTQQPT
jgi:hypothetical protein